MWQKCKNSRYPERFPFVLSSGGLGRGPAHFGPAWAGFLTAHQGPEAHFGPNLALKIGPARPGPKI